MVVHIPHSSKILPLKFEWGLTDTEISEELEKMTDYKTDVLFFHKNALIFPYSRIYCDVERLLNDDMEEIGMGICYESTSDGKPILKSKADRKEAMRLYKEHHKRLEKMVAAELKQHGKCLVIDAHSFPKVPLPYEKDTNRPDICIGTNKWDDGVVEIANYAAEYFGEKGYAVSFNSPFFGSMIPEKFKYDKRASSLMIEVNRSIYTGRNFSKVFTDIQLLLVRLERIYLKKD